MRARHAPKLGYESIYDQHDGSDDEPVLSSAQGVGWDRSMGCRA